MIEREGARVNVHPYALAWLDDLALPVNEAWLEDLPWAANGIGAPMAAISVLGTPTGPAA